MPNGEVVDLFVAPVAGGTMIRKPTAEAVAGRGLIGDRYYDAQGSFSRWSGPHREVTLIAVEDLDAIGRDHGMVLKPEESRRNILTRGVSLHDLVKVEFQIGNVWLRGERRCQPCKYLARLTGKPDLVRAMIHRGGLRARILSNGEIRVGDTIQSGERTKKAPAGYPYRSF